MKTRALLLASAITGILCFSIPAAFAKTAGCPCSPCKCAPCTCGGGGSKSGGGGKHHEGGDHHGDHHGHHGHDGGSSVGVGVSVDLSGVGHRTREADPFATGGNDKPVAHTEEKRISKHKEKEPTTNSFDEIKLTGQDAKDGNNPPQGTFNVNNDETPQTTDAATELKKAHDKYHDARTEWLKKQPTYTQVMHDLTQSPNTEEGNRKANKAKKKFDKMIDQFNGGDGKDLVDDWKKAFDSTLKSGGTVDDNSMIPPPQNDIEKKKYAVLKAQNDLKLAQKNYDDIKQNAANKDENVEKTRKAVQDFKSTNDPGYKGAVADFDKAVNEAGGKWAGTDEGKKELQKVKDAEKELDKAKEAWKPYEKYVEK